MKAKSSTVLNGIQEIRQYLSENEQPIYFVSATNFNLLGMDEFVKNFKYITYIDSFDGHHPNLILPKNKSAIVFEGIEAINNYLLENKDVLDVIDADHKRTGYAGDTHMVFLFFDKETERICQELGHHMCVLPAAFQQEIDNKVVTTQIGNEAGVPSVPNALEKIDSYKTLELVSAKAGLGKDLVVQTAYGDSGKTTFFISNEVDYKKYKDKIEAEDVVKVMRCIRCRGTAMEATITKSGTITGPLMTELIGFDSLTPYKGGWCGNELYRGAFSDAVLKKTQDYAIQLGTVLQKRGYKGTFEMDFLLDLDTDDVYLGEINPRITGISAMTNLSEFASSTLPPFLFHMMEFMDVDYTFDVAAYNAHCLAHGASQTWGQLILKHTDDDLKIVTEAPKSGLWEMTDTGEITFEGPFVHRRTAQNDTQAFYLRISKEADYFYKGADIGILFLRTRLMTDAGELTENASKWINALHESYVLRDLTQEEQLMVARYRNPGQLKAF